MLGNRVMAWCVAMAVGCGSATTAPLEDADATAEADEATGADGDGAADADGDAETGGEVDGAADADGDADACTATCGNGVAECAEQCDDGNTRAGDGCDGACAIEVSPTCGDGTVDLASGEECDDANTVDGDGCSGLCRIEASPSCGDATLDLDAGEQCDDGNTTAGDGCSPSCQFEPVGALCGDGTTDPLEACDDGNTANGDACNPTCNLANTTTLFVGTHGVAGRADGVGPAALLGGSGGLAVDATTLYVGDGGNNTLRRIDIATATVTTFAGDAAGGAAGYVDDPTGLNARFSGIGSVATDGTTLWVGDEANHRIRAVSLAPPHAVTTLAGSGAVGLVDGIGAAAQFEGIRGLTYDGGWLYLVDGTTNVVRRIDPVSGAVLTVAGTARSTTGCPPGGGPVDGIGLAAVFCSPRYMTTDGSGVLYIADTNGNMIRSYNTVTSYVGSFAGTGACGYVDGIGAAAAIHRPRGMASDGTSIYIAEFNAHTVRQGVLATREVTTLLGTPAACTRDCSCGTTPAGGYVEGVGAAAQLNNPFAMVWHHPTRSLFVLDSGNYVIRRVR